MDLESFPERLSTFVTECGAQGFLAMRVQLVHDDVDFGCLRMRVGDLLHGPGKLDSLAVSGRVGPMAPCLWRHDAEDIRRPTPAIFVVAVGELAWR